MSFKNKKTLIFIINKIINRYENGIYLHRFINIIPSWNDIDITNEFLKRKGCYYNDNNNKIYIKDGYEMVKMYNQWHKGDKIQDNYVLNYYLDLLEDSEFDIYTEKELLLIKMNIMRKSKRLPVELNDMINKKLN